MNTPQALAFRDKINKKIPIKYIDDEGNRHYDCPACHTGDIKVNSNVFYGRCDNCKLTLIDYKPLDHQEAFHKSGAQYRMLIGGFGSGKTTGCCAEFGTHGLSTPNGKGLITANTINQVRDAVIPELNKFLPPWFIQSSRMNPSPYYKLTNGFEIVVYPSNDKENIRSLNLTAFYIEEASGVPYDIFDVLTTRLRHKMGIIRDAKGAEVGYKYLGLVSTNPEEGWIKDKFLFISDKIVGSPSIDVTVYNNIKKKSADKHYHTFISSTRDNYYLPKGYIERTTAGKTAKWIRKYIDCYLDIKEGAVYPEMAKYFVEPFEIPRNWVRVAGFDPGFNDPTAVPVGAIRPSDGAIFIYSDYYEPEKPVSYHAKEVKNMLSGFTLLFPVQADPSVERRNERDLKTYKTYFYELSGIFLESANNDILYGIERVRDYMYLGKLFIFNTCENIKMESQLYAYPKLENKNTNDVPIDKYNHLMDGLRYILTKLPQNPLDMETIFVNKELMEIYNYAPTKSNDIDTVFAGDNIEVSQSVVYGNGIYGRNFR